MTDEIYNRVVIYTVIATVFILGYGMYHLHEFKAEQRQMNGEIYHALHIQSDFNEAIAETLVEYQKR